MRRLAQRLFSSSGVPVALVLIEEKVGLYPLTHLLRTAPHARACSTFQGILLLSLWHASTRKLAVRVASNPSSPLPTGTYIKMTRDDVEEVYIIRNSQEE